MTGLFPTCYAYSYAHVTLPHVGVPEDADYPGRRLGLPHSGPGAVAGWGRRLLAIFIDFTMARLAVAAFVGSKVFVPEASQQTAGLLFLPIVVMGIEIWILTGLLGGSAGQLIVGVGVRRTSGGPLDPLRGFGRAVAICLVIPAVIYNRDQQGLHDLMADSVAIRTR